MNKAKQCKILSEHNYKDYLPLGNIVAFSYAEPGAMGGGNTIITENGDIYTLRIPYSEDILPIFKSFLFDVAHGRGVKIPEGWTYKYMGMGNHLAISNTILDAYNKHVQKYDIKIPPELYRLWKTVILEAISDK